MTSGDELTVTILGSGTSTGVPVPGCRCAVCASADPRDQRTRCSALVTWRDRHILLDTATDLRQQALREKLSHIDAVLFTHTHADHVHGIDDLRTFSRSDRPPLPVFAAAESLATLRRVFAYIFSEPAQPGYRPNLAAWTVAGPFLLFGLPVQPVALPHGTGTSLGYRLGPMAYLTDCSAIPATVERHLQNLDLLIIDALRFRPHETHFNIAEAIAAARRLGARRTLLTHLSHEVAHARDDRGLPDGFELAYDGQTIHLPFARQIHWDEALYG
jgi:phosphoribosyl 1,2-cyclic phosphate phosphodiesterase